MGKISEKIKELESLVQENPDNEFFFCLVSDFQNVTGFCQIPENRMESSIDLLAELYKERPVYAQLLLNGMSKFFYDLKKQKEEIINMFNNQNKN